MNDQFENRHSRNNMPRYFTIGRRFAERRAITSGEASRAFTLLSHLKITMQRRWFPRSERRRLCGLLSDGHLKSIAAAIVILMTLLSLLPVAKTRAASQTVVSLTFDDGRATAYTARSILASHNMHATFYVNSPLLGSSSFYMTWQQVNDLYSDGNEIGGHTAYHVNLPQIDPTEAQRQICDDRVNILNHGYPATDFAYPYGYYNSSIESMVQACGYNSARSTDSLSGGAESIPPANP